MKTETSKKWGKALLTAAGIFSAAWVVGFAFGLGLGHAGGLVRIVVQ